MKKTILCFTAMAMMVALSGCESKPAVEANPPEAKGVVKPVEGTGETQAVEPINPKKPKQQQ